MWKTCVNSDTLASALLVWDKEVSWLILEQLKTIDLAKKVWDKNIEKIADVQLKWVLDAVIIQSDDANALAKTKLIKSISKNESLATKKNMERLLNTLDNFKKELWDKDKMAELFKALWKKDDDAVRLLNDAIDKYEKAICTKYEWYNVFNVVNRLLREGTKKISAEDKRNSINKFLKWNINDLIDKGIINIDNKELYIKDIDSKIKRLKKERDDYIAKNGGKVKKWDTTITDLSESIERYTEIKNTINKDKRLEKKKVDVKKTNKEINKIDKEIKTKEDAIVEAEKKLKRLRKQEKKDEVNRYIQSLRDEITALNNKKNELNSIVKQASWGSPDHFWDYLEHEWDFKENFIERDFKNWRTIQEIAEHYGVPIFVVDLYKYGSTKWLTISQTIDDRLAGIIVTIRGDAERWILHHECFHAISKLMDWEQYLSLLKDMQQKLWFDAKTSEEMLADMFFEYFKTWKINTPFKEIKNTQSRIASFFKRLKDLLLWKTKITLWDELKKKISQFYDDMLDWKIAKEYESFNNDFGDIVKELEEEWDFYWARWYWDDENLKFLDEAWKFSDKVDAMKKNAKNRVTDEFDVNDTIENIKKQVEDKLEKLQSTFDRELALPDANIKLDDVIDSIDVDELTNTINKVLDDYSDYITYKDRQDILYYFDTITSWLKTLKEWWNTELAKDLANTDVGFVSFLRRKLWEIEKAISTVKPDKAEELNDLVWPILNLEEIVRTGRYVQYESTFSRQQGFVQDSMERYATILNAIEWWEVNTIEEINKLNKEILWYNDELSEETSKYSYSNRWDIDTEFGYYSEDISQQTEYIDNIVKADDDDIFGKADVKDKIKNIKDILSGKKDIDNMDATYILARELLWEDLWFNQYVTARVLLSEGSEVAEGILKGVALGEIMKGALSVERIKRISTLEELASIAFSYTDKFKDNEKLLKAFMDKKDALLSNTDDANKLALMDSLSNIAIYWDSYYKNMKYDLFASSLKALWYDIPYKNNRDVYRDIANCILEGKDYKRTLRREGKDILEDWKVKEEVIIKRSDMDKLMLAYLPKKYLFNNVAELITIAWYDDVISKLKNALSDNIWDVDFDTIFNEDKLDSIMNKYKELFKDPKVEDRNAIVLKALTNKSIDVNQTLFIWNRWRVITSDEDVTKDMWAKANLYNSLSKSNSIIAVEWLWNNRMFNSIDDVSTNYDFDWIRYIIVEWDRSNADKELIDRINSINEKRKDNNKIEIIDNKYMAQGRFYFDKWDWNLKFWLMSEKNMDEFVDTIWETWVDIDLNRTEDIPWLITRFNRYITSLFWEWDAMWKYQKIRDLFWSFYKLWEDWKYLKRNGELEIDVYELERYIDQSLNATGKYKVDVINLWDAWDNIPQNQEAYKMIAQQWADQLWLTFNREITEWLDTNTIKELFFSAMYNTNMVEWIRARYAFLKYMWVTWVANDVDKIAGINYVFNKVLKDSWYNMWILQSDEFIGKVLKWEDLDWDLWKANFIKANMWNPEFKWIPWEDYNEKFDNLLQNIKDSIWFDNIKERLTFPWTYKEWSIQFMKHEGEEAVYKMLYNNQADNFWMLNNLESYWLYLWNSKNLDVRDIAEMDIVNSVIDDYIRRMRNVWEGKTPGWYKAALELKDELEFILNTIDNKIIIPKYWTALDLDWMRILSRVRSRGIELNTSMNEGNINSFMNEMENLRNDYRNIWNKIRQRREQLANMNPEDKMQVLRDTWVVFIDNWRGWLYPMTADDIVMKLRNEINSIDWRESYSDDIENLLALTDKEIGSLSINQKIRVAEKLWIVQHDLRKKTIIEQIYNQLSPIFATTKFFKRYKLDTNWYPELFKTENLSLITDANVWEEETVKLFNDVYDSLMASYFTEGKSIKWWLTMQFWDTFRNPDVDEIRYTVNKIVNETFTELTDKQRWDITSYVTNIFLPYSQLESLPKQVMSLIDAKLWETINPMLTALWVTKEWLISDYWNLLLTDKWWVSRTVSQLYSDNSNNAMQSMWYYVRNWNKTKELISLNNVNKWWLNAPTEKELYDKIQRATNTAISVMDNFTKVTDLDRAAASDAMWWVRDLFESNVFLKRFADTDDLMRARASDVWTNLRSAVIWRWTSTWQEVFPRFRALWIWGNLLQSWFKEERWRQVVAYYNKYYGMNFNEVMALNADKLSDPLESSALQMAQYFKQVENMLGSPNGLRWVTTDMATNIAFYNIWDCVNYVKTAEWFIALTSWIQQNQFLKFMKLNKKGSRWYSEFFNRISQTTTGKRQFGSEWMRSRREIRNDLNNTLLGNNMSAEDFAIFKQMFWLTEDYGAKDADRIVAALWWFKANNWWNRTMWRFLSWLGKSSLIMRMLTSYPWGLMTIWYQQVWYEVRRDALTKGLWVSSSDLSKWSSLRKSEGMMTDTYFEMPNFRWDVEDIERIREMVNSLYEDVDSVIFDKIMKESHLKKGDSWETAYAKILQTLENTDVKKFLDNTKENANNIIDWINAKAMKDIAFAQAVLTNDVYKFYSPEDYMKFMFDKSIDADLKARVRQAIEIKAQRSFSDLMWLSWTSTMAQITNWTFWDFLMSMYNIINFRWQWGTVILRQTITRLKELFWVGWYVAKNLGKPWLADEVSAWVMKTPEMQNFIYWLVWDVYWTFKAAREMERNDPDKEWEFQDALDLLSFTSMRMQWLSSGALGRMFFKWLEQVEYATHYWDYSLENILWQTGYAILQSFVQNFWRNFKLDAFITDWLMVWLQYGNEEQVWNYITDQFFNLSQWSLRYMMDSTNYDSWINLWTERWPRYYVMWTATNKDNQFLNARDIAISFNSIVSWINQMWWDNVEESTDLVWATYSLLNQSKIFKTIENLKGAVKWGMRRASWDEEQKKANINERKNIYTIDQFDDIVKTQRIAKQIENSWYFTPKTWDQVNSLSKAFMNAKVPWGGSFLTMLKNRVEWITDPGDYLEENKDCKLLLDKLWEKNVKDIYKTLTDMYADKKTDSKDVRYKEIMMISQIVDSELSEDPQFPELQKILYKWVMQLNYDLFEDNEYQKFKESELASWKKSKDIISKTNWLKLDWNEQRLKTQYVNDHNKEWADVDSKTYLNVAFESMYLENPDAFKWFIDYKWFDNKPQIKSRWRRDYEMALKANDEFDRWLWRDWLNTMSLVIKYSDYKDPSGIAGWLAIKDTLQYIDEMPWYSFADKANLKAKLAIENYSILKKLENTEDYLGKDNYIFWLASDILYNADQHLAQAIQELTQAYEAGNDWNKKKGWSAGTLRELKANKIKLDDLQGGNRWTVRGNGWYNWLTSLSSPKINGSEFLRWVNQKRKKATSTNAVDFSVKKYTDVPLIAQPKDLWKPKKIKGRKTTTKKSTYKSPTA